MVEKLLINRVPGTTAILQAGCHGEWVVFARLFSVGAVFVNLLLLLESKTLSSFWRPHLVLSGLLKSFSASCVSPYRWSCRIRVYCLALAELWACMV